jgi:protein-disulfide isomerase
MRSSPSSRKLKVASLALLALALGMSALAVFQWVELQVVRAGGQSVCSINAHFNCETVWTSPFAVRMHHLLHMPVAALGLVWGLAAVVVSLRLVVLTFRGQPERPAVPPVRLLGLAGLAGCLTFAVAHALTSAICLTCLATYALAAGFAAVAFFALPEPLGIERTELKSALLWAGAPVLLAYLVLLVPAQRTPEEGALPSKARGLSAGEMSSPEGRAQALDAFLGSLPPQARQALSDMLARYRQEQVPAGAESFAPRSILGDSRAPMRIVEFTDVLCSHCRHFSEVLRSLREKLPPGSFSVESRYFPLDSECNPSVQQSSGTGVRCLGAKAEICLEGRPEFSSVQESLFAEQAQLAAGRVEELASQGSLSRPELDACVASAVTASKLADDVRYAQLYDIEGTPLVLVNGKKAGPSPLFLFVLALAGGDPNAPAFQSLPAPSAAPGP